MPDLFFDVDAALAEVPVNIMPLLDDSDFKSKEEAVAYDAAGMDLVWTFVTCAGATTQTVVTPTTGGDYDWAHQGNAMYTIEVPASGGGSINNDTEGFGWFTGVATGILPWRGPVIGFRDTDLNNLLIESAYSATRGLAGTALPAAVADAAGGLPISDAGGLDLDALNTAAVRLTAARAGILDDWIDAGRLDALLDAIKAVADNLPDAGALTTIGADTARLTAARAGALTDWINGGRLDLLLDAIKAITDNLPDSGALTTIATDTARLTAARAGVLDDWVDAGRLDVLLDAIKTVADNLPDSGALTTIGADTARLTAVRAAILTDWIDGGRLDLLLDAAKAVTDNLPDSGALTTIGADTARLTAARAGSLTDWIDGGRLDLLLDAIKAITDNLPNSGALNDLTTLAGRLTAARAGYLDELAAANVPADVDTLIARLTAARAGYLDSLNGHTAQTGDSYPQVTHATYGLAVLEALVDNLESRLTAARAGYLDELAGGNLPTDVAAINALIVALNDLSAAQVNAQVVDVMAVDAHAEPGQGDPPASPTKLEILQYLYKSWRNKNTQTGAVGALYNDAGDTIDQKRTVSDDLTTATSGKMGTGP